MSSNSIFRRVIKSKALWIFLIGIGLVQIAFFEVRDSFPKKVRGFKPKPDPWTAGGRRHCLNVELLTRELSTTEGPPPNYRICKITFRNVDDDTTLSDTFSTCQGFPSEASWIDIEQPTDVRFPDAGWEQNYSQFRILKKEDCEFDAPTRIQEVKGKLGAIKIGEPTDKFKAVFPGSIPLVWGGNVRDQMFVRIDPGIMLIFRVQYAPTNDKKAVPYVVDSPVSVKVDPWTDRECKMWKGNWVASKFGHPSPSGEPGICHVPDAGKYETAF